MAADWKCPLKVEGAGLKVLPRPECSLTSLNPRVHQSHTRICRFSKMATWPPDISRPSTTGVATPQHPWRTLWNDLNDTGEGGCLGGGLLCSVSRSTRGGAIFSRDWGQ